MLIYFEFEHRRSKADVILPHKESDSIIVHLHDAWLIRKLPSDLYFETDKSNKVIFTLENPDHKRLSELQRVLGKRLQELVNKS